MLGTFADALYCVLTWALWALVSVALAASLQAHQATVVRAVPR